MAPHLPGDERTGAGEQPQQELGAVRAADSCACPRSAALASTDCALMVGSLCSGFDRAETIVKIQSKMTLYSMNIE